jgi:hypothetical protein
MDVLTRIVVPGGASETWLGSESRMPRSHRGVGQVEC